MQQKRKIEVINLQKILQKPTEHDRMRQEKKEGVMI